MGAYNRGMPTGQRPQRHAIYTDLSDPERELLLRRSPEDIVEEIKTLENEERLAGQGILNLRGDAKQLRKSILNICDRRRDELLKALQTMQAANKRS